MVIVPRIVAAPHAGAWRFRSAKRAASLLAGPSFSLLLSSSARSRRTADPLFVGQKRQALRKCWNSGLKIAPRVNPG